MTARPVASRPVTGQPVTSPPVTSRKEAPVSRYRQWNELLELVTDAGIAAGDRARLEDEGVEVVVA